MKRPSLLWIAVVLCMTIGWALVWVVDKSCEFVTLPALSQQDDGSTTTTITTMVRITRGTQRGMLKPGDACQAWGKYDDLELDPKMVITRVAASMSIVLGAFCLLIMIAWLRVSRVWLSRLTALLAFIIAVLQALTHLMVHSDLCEQTTASSETNDGGDDADGEDACNRSTVAYKCTYFNMALWLAVAILLLRLPLWKDDRHQEETMMPTMADKNVLECSDNEVEKQTKDEESIL